MGVHTAIKKNRSEACFAGPAPASDRPIYLTAADPALR